MTKKLYPVIFYSIFFTLTFPLFTQEKLSNFNTSWSSVLPGNAICQPAVTSYGFCLATDARNIMGYSSNGTLLWEKKTGRVRNLTLTTLNGDFILFHDKDKNVIRLYNPSGTEIWYQSIDFKLTEKPFAGRDGRFFLYGEKTIICEGINGIIRWKTETEYQKNLPMQELPDGSIIIFLNDTEGKTRGLRISPFGEMLETITFAGSIKTADTCKDGILLTFIDGSAGLFSLKDGLAESRWVASTKSGNALFTVHKNRQKYFLLSLSKNEITIYSLKAEDGSVELSKTISGIDGTSLLQARVTDSGIFLADNNKALLIDFDFNLCWEAILPETVKNKTVNQLIYLEDDYLLMCSKNWSMNAYHTIQTTGRANKGDSVLKNIQADYSSFAPVDLNEINYYSQGAILSSVKDSEHSLKLKEGMYGSEEKLWLSQALSIARLYSMDTLSSDFGTRTEKSVFQTDSAGVEAVFVQLALLCTQQSQNAAATILQNSTNKTYCRAILSNLYGYDPDGKLLDAIERNTSRAGNKDSSYLKAICDSVYSICLFMGRPAYNKKGKEILKSLMGVGYNSDTRTYARDTLKKIIALEL